MLHDKYDISHVTLQFEIDRCEEKTFFRAYHFFISNLLRKGNR